MVLAENWTTYGILLEEFFNEIKRKTFAVKKHGKTVTTDKISSFEKSKILIDSKQLLIQTKNLKTSPIPEKW